MKYNIRSIACLLVLISGFALTVRADDPKYTVEDIMKAVYKGEDSLHKKIVKGNASKDELAKLVQYVSVLPQNDPPQGDSEGWKKKTAALVEAAKALQAGKDGALEKYIKAANCQSCHSVYRPD